ncbi:hypothetical protein [Novipirellula aureliae]|uniref:hypothetical protein n=1 Tax=Novipirellula aureliae TaxID=2527966 RepID=UPI0011B36B45|nr:hypothetical protein [Novipirellula aureliae]
MSGQRIGFGDHFVRMITTSMHLFQIACGSGNRSLARFRMLETITMTMMRAATQHRVNGEHDER